jgi:hypothetical protein
MELPAVVSEWKTMEDQSSRVWRYFWRQLVFGGLRTWQQSWAVNKGSNLRVKVKLNLAEMSAGFTKKN